MNCCSLIGHLKDIRLDQKLLQADILHLQETSLASDFLDDGLKIDGYTSSFTKIGRGKGIGTYTKETINLHHLATIGRPNLQISKSSLIQGNGDAFNAVQIFNIYRSSDSKVEDLIDHLIDLIEVNQTTLITGDLNICKVKEPKNKVTTLLTRMGFKELIDEATHIQGGHIDHTYWIDPDGRWQSPSVERYSPYYSDHDGLLITLKR